MLLQAQAITPSGVVLFYENREIGTPREAEEFRSYMERCSGAGPDSVRVVDADAPLALRIPMMVQKPGRGEK